MRKLILDQYTHQSIFKRFLGNTLTGLAWAFWVYLWLPLIAAITLLLGAHPEQATTAASRTLLDLLAILTSHASMVVVMIVGFLIWSLLQALGKRYRRKALRKSQVKWVRSASPSNHTAQDMQRWQQTQSMVVSHNDASGCIQQVEILKPKSKIAQREYPVAYLRNMSPNPIRQCNSLAINFHR